MKGSRYNFNPQFYIKGFIFLIKAVYIASVMMAKVPLSDEKLLLILVLNFKIWIITPDSFMLKQRDTREGCSHFM